MKIGFIGVGAMGKPMAKNLINTGYEVSVYDLRPEQVQELASLGAIPCETNLEVSASVDIVFTSLPNAAIVETVMNGPGGIFKACKKGTIIIDMSSVSPSSTQKMAAIAEKMGLEYVDAPVSGGTKGAESGNLTIMVGARPNIFEKIKPVLNVIGKNIYHVGETGLGNAIKIINNLLLGGNMAVLAEALILGVKCGLEPEVMKEIISVSSGGSYVLNAKMENFIIKDNFQGGFSMDLQYKDLGLALEAGRETNMPLPLTSAAAQIFESGRALGLGREDMSSVIKVWENITGTTIAGGLCKGGE